jgi:5-formyltetrahydrofolate cyclo-ligase
MSQKQELRSRMRKLRENLPHKEKLSKQITSSLLRLEEMSAAWVVFCYVSTPHEVNTYELIDCLWRKQKTVCVSKVKADTNEMVAVEISNFHELEVGKYGILEPKSNNIM